MEGFQQSLSSSIFSSSPLLAAFSGRGSTTSTEGSNQPQLTQPSSNGTVSSLLSRQLPGLTFKGSSSSNVLSSSASPQPQPHSTSLDSSAVSARSPQASNAHTMEGKQERGREKRIMPARLQRVSNLLAGSTLEDELSGANAKLEAHLLPPQTNFVLFTGPTPNFSMGDTHIKPQGESLFATPKFVKSCRIREMIETPDFKQRDDTEMMGKTRSIRSEEDTSDAAYERRHRKPDNLEKKQRRLEKERLVRDRQKLKERIDQLRVADVRLLAPILNAREQQQKQTEGDVGAVSPGGVEQGGQKQQSMTMDASQTLAKLELLRSELLEEAHDTLKRYDALLLAPTETVTPMHLGKRRPGGDGGVADAGGEASSKAARSISVSGAFANKAGKSQTVNRAASFSAATKDKRAGKRKSQSPLDVKTKRLSAGATLPVSPQPFKPEDGTVRAENTYANIHARTSGGRFAPKSALAGTGGSTSKINTKGKWKAEGGQGKPPRKPRTSSTSKAKAAASGSKGAAGSTSAETADGKPKRVKIILNKRRKTAEGEEAASESTSLSSIVDESGGKMAVDVEEMEVDSTPQRAARSALTLEEAQALLAKAMEDDDDDDDEEIELEVKREDAGNI